MATNKKQRTKKIGRVEEVERAEYFEFDDHTRNECDGVSGNYYHWLNGDPITPGSMVEVLWPDGKVSQHKIRCGLNYDEYESWHGGEPIRITNYCPYITIDNHHGANLGEVLLESIDGIKLRIVRN